MSPRARTRTLSRRAGLLLVAFSLLAPPAHAAKFAGAFMADGGGARALGLGSAFVAIADDASATFWNPAGLVDLKRPEVLLMHSERFGDLVDRDFASYVHPLRDRESAFGFSIIRLGVDDIPFTDHLADQLDTNGDGVVDDNEILKILDPEFRDQIKFKSDEEFALFASYAHRFAGWQIGGNLKFVRQSVGDFSSVGVGADLGVLRRGFLVESLDIGLKLQDITTTYLSWSTGHNEVIAPVVVPGAAYLWSSERNGVQVRVAGALELHFDDRGDADQFSSGSLSGNGFVGVETILGGRASLRFGSHGGWDSEDLTYGAGLDLGRLRVDYAFAGDVLDVDRNTHRVSVAVGF